LPLESSRSVCRNHKLSFHLSESLPGTEDRQKLHKITKDLETQEPTTDEARYCQKLHLPSM